MQRGRPSPAARQGFPADLISEAVDQTRGWFYTLHVLGVLLFDSVAYRSCIVPSAQRSQGQEISSIPGRCGSNCAGS